MIGGRLADTARGAIPCDEAGSIPVASTEHDEARLGRLIREREPDLSKLIAERERFEAAVDEVGYIIASEIVATWRVRDAIERLERAK